jgi:hypothetical protein
VSFTAFWTGQAILSSQHAGVPLDHPRALRATIGAGLYLSAVGLLGFGVGAAVRHTAGAMATLFGLLFLPSALADLLPPSLHYVIEYMPANSGSQVFTAHHTSPALSPWAGFGVFCLYVVVSLIAGFVVTQVRDTPTE